MIEKPGLPDHQICDCLVQAFAIPVTRLEFLPLGNDAAAWAYRVGAADGHRYFLKVRRGTPDEAAVTVPRYLKKQGVEQVVAPLLTQNQGLWQPLDDFSLILYPFVEGEIGMEAGLSDAQWITFGATLKQIHTTPISAELRRQVALERFAPWGSDIVRKLQPQIITGSYHDSVEEELATFWRDNRRLIWEIAERAAALGQQLQQRPADFVLCHADIHTANILVGEADTIAIVDWDYPAIAPKERDLKFVIGASVGGFHIGPHEETLFLDGYGPTEVDLLALAYYRYEWVVADIADYGQRVFERDDLGQQTKQQAVTGFKSMFQPGDVVQLALASATQLGAAVTKAYHS